MLDRYRPGFSSAPSADASAGSFLARISTNPVNAALLERLPALGLPQGFLTAGCLFQAIWNHRSGQPTGQGVKDYDVFYFDDRDLSWEAEDAVIRRVAEATRDLRDGMGAVIEVKNQARVHLWYEQRFGSSYPRLTSARDGIGRYLVACTCIGIEAATGAVHAPDGFGDLEAGILRMNPLSGNRHDLFRRKAESYRARWPWLSIAEPDPKGGPLTP
ncbi:nucleotidyltransferase family protein [Roseomonas mucosa]